MSIRTGVLLLFLASLAPPTVAAPARLVAVINDTRAAGCDRRPGIPSKLRHDPQLDRVAKALAGGSSLEDALRDAGYRAQQSATLEVSGASTAAIERTLAERGCKDIADPVYRAVGVAERTNRAWIVLATPFVPPSAGEAGDVSRRVLALVNEARASPRRCGWKRFAAAPPLVPSDVLQRAALAHARDMAERGNLSHTGADGSTAGERATRAGYRWRVAGENIAAGQSTSEQVVADWLKSPRHCTNIMDADFSEMGIAYAATPQGAPGIYWTQMLAAPLAAAQSTGR